MGQLSGWKYRQKITIDRTKFDSTDVTHFPITVFLEGNTDFWNEMGSGDSQKVAFTKSDGTTELYAEIEQYDSVNNKAVYHVSKSGWTINNDGAEDDYIYIYYDSSHADNTTYIGDTNSTPAENVWDSNFKVVYHMADGADPSHVYDSTSNNNNGTKTAANEPNEVSGKVANAQDFDGNNDEIESSTPHSNLPEISALRAV